MGGLRLIVDGSDSPVGAKQGREMQYADIYRVSALWLTDKQSGDILLAQRKWTERNDPGKWITAVAGTVEVNETYEDNIVKEIEEEIGLTGLTLTAGPKLFIDDAKHKYFCQWFLSSVDKNNVTLKIQEEEVEAVKWVSKAWLLRDAKDHPQSYPPTMLETLAALGIA
jgi:isopentenyldiphosphate isomerase